MKLHYFSLYFAVPDRDDLCHLDDFDAVGLTWPKRHSIVVMVILAHILQEELMAIPDAMLDSRENAMRNGVMFGGKRYEVHRYHPEENMIYGRNMDVTPDKSTGWALL